jgi:hypothetical protein
MGGKSGFGEGKERGREGEGPPFKIFFTQVRPQMSSDIFGIPIEIIPHLRKISNYIIHGSIKGSTLFHEHQVEGCNGVG